LEFRVDTNSDVVRRFIDRDTPGVKVVFSTYQSSHVVSEGVRGLAPFDVAIFDEAHKTTGPQGGLFAHSLKDENIRIRKRLFFTATPRHYEFGIVIKRATSVSSRWTMRRSTVHAHIL
jgi:predicted helicase